MAITDLKIFLKADRREGSNWSTKGTVQQGTPGDPACCSGGGGVALSSKTSARSWMSYVSGMLRAGGICVFLNICLLNTSCILKGDSTPAGCLGGVSASEQPVYLLGSVLWSISGTPSSSTCVQILCFHYVL